MYKKWQEFDNIHTPESWVEETINKTRKSNHFYMIRRIAFTLITVCCLVFGSLGIVYAVSPTFREWLHSYFSSDNIQQSSLINNDEKYAVEDKFLYTYKNEEDVSKVYVYNNNDFQNKEIEHYEGVINQQEYSFDYVIDNDRIFSFHHTGVILKTYAPIFNNKIYVWLTISDKNNLGILDLKTKEISLITDDNISVNSIVSPQGDNILINKSDQYWTVYNRRSKKETRINDISPYAHSNEIRFIDENHIQTFGSDDNTIIINLETKEVKRYNFQTLDCSVMTIEKDNGKTYLKNIINNNRYELKDDYDNSGGFRGYGNRFLFFQNEKSLLIYDIKSNKLTEMNSLDFQIQLVLQLDDNHILFGQDQQIYVVEINN
ncbi:MAG: hypothetical protein RR585_05075 [Coprobacillus sp.]